MILETKVSSDNIFSMVKILKPLDHIFLISDLHFGLASNSYEWLDYTRMFFHKFLIPTLRDYLKKYPDLVLVVAGDINNIKDQIDNLILSEEIEIFEELASILPVLAFPGNHDSPFLGKKSMGDDKRYVNSCRSIGLIENVQIFNKPIELPCTDGKVLLVPFQSSKEKELEIIQSCSADVNYCIMHTSIEGFFYEGKKVDADKSNKREDFKKFKRVFSGHVHKRQDEGNIEFIGAPYHTKTSECDNQCGITFFNFTDGTETYVENTVSPRFKEISIFKILEMTVPEANNFINNAFVEVYVPSNLMYKMNMNSITEKLTGYRSFELTTVSDKIKAGKQEIDENLYVYKNINIQEKLVEFIAEMDEAKLDKNFIKVTDGIRKNLKETVENLHKAAEQKFAEKELIVNN